MSSIDDIRKITHTSPTQLSSAQVVGVKCTSLTHTQHLRNTINRTL